ncbi:MAG: Hpt domain-containing protein [Phycisphaerales bacterium]
MAQTFDQAELMERVDNDAAFLAETVEMLVSDGPTLMAQVRAAISAGDAASLGRSAHSLKGMISNFCAPTAQAAALELEKLGKAGNLSPAPAAADIAQQHLQALTDELVAFVKANS